MRQRLKSIGGKERHVFYGTFKKFGIKSGFKCNLKTVLLVDIEDENHEIITTHLWFNYTNGFKKLDLKPGDKVKFNGRIKPYIKGYFGRRDDVFAPISMDYLIQYPTKIELVKRKKQKREQNGKDC